MEKDMATHSSILAWRMPWTRSLEGYSPRGRKESDTTERLNWTEYIENYGMCCAAMHTQACPTLRPHGLQHASLSTTNSRSLPKPLSIESMMPSNHLILCCPFLVLPSIFPSIMVLSNESALRIRWPKYWSFSFSIRPSNEHPGLISFRMDWLHLLAVQGTLKSLLQHHSSKASILRRSAFFLVQLSHPYTTTGKTTALTRRTFVDKVMSLLFNMLSRLVTAFLPKSVFYFHGWSHRLQWF